MEDDDKVKERKDREEREKKEREEKDLKERAKKERERREREEKEKKEKERKEKEEDREKGKGVCAIALYSFKGTDPADLPFEVGDRIEDVKIPPGKKWW
eukprot:CAMPEP_0201529218 /NCGR_PEP_ID=MMETSP0161_2-20130828/40966_1 /ASSEMBLY_ACC=CAM_ASM_000251 /TAXON_ID=180227 /ORGANISM="Neoparamoeba aestuarina, Strain SoJaBio B1-5/56/2" /LENGTH=98 /DNA_ID=CAMNT_0047930911 /DNA_START=284 /DNA_END=577 /DNA_ORIENTATION=+